MRYTKRQMENYMRLCTKLARYGLDSDDVDTLLKCERTLQRWAEQECGDSNGYRSWMIERDEETDIPYMVTDHYDSDSVLPDEAFQEKVNRRTEEYWTGKRPITNPYWDAYWTVEKKKRRSWLKSRVWEEIANEFGAPQKGVSRIRIPDREKGALKRAAKIAAKANPPLRVYHQTDPRGCQLYLLPDSITDESASSTYTNGIGVWI